MASIAKATYSGPSHEEHYTSISPMNVPLGPLTSPLCLPPPLSYCWMARKRRMSPHSASDISPFAVTRSRCRARIRSQRPTYFSRWGARLLHIQPMSPTWHGEKSRIISCLNRRYPTTAEDEPLCPPKQHVVGGLRRPMALQYLDVGTCQDENGA